MSIRNILKRTPLYPPLRRARLKRALLTWTEHDQAMLRFYSQFIPSGSLCFDVGANVGNRVKIFLKLQSRVVAVEPQEECADILESAFRGARLTVVRKAVGSQEGDAEMMVGSSDTIASLSEGWVDAVSQSGRFGAHRWGERRRVPVITLDALVERYGAPAFVKVDVEGYEYEVVKGLTRPVRCMSLEFTPEYLDSTFKCLERLESLSPIRCNYSLGEAVRLELPGWVTAREMVAALSRFRHDHQLFGDVYVDSQV